MVYALVSLPLIPTPLPSIPSTRTLQCTIVVFQALSLFQKQKAAPPGNSISVSLSVNSPVHTGESRCIKWNLDQRSRFMSRSERVSYIGLANEFEQHRQIWCSGFCILVALFYMHLITADTTADGFHFRSKGVRESKIKGVWIFQLYLDICAQ